MNPESLLALIADLYAQLRAAVAEVEALRAREQERDLADAARAADAEARKTPA